jgi:hypothetical protein
MFNSDDELFPYVRISQVDQVPVPVAALRDPELSRLGWQMTIGEQDSLGSVRRLAETRVAELYGIPREKDTIAATKATHVSL